MGSLFFNLVSDPQTLASYLPKLPSIPTLRKIPSFIVHCSSLKPKPRPRQQISQIPSPQPNFPRTHLQNPTFDPSLPTKIQKLVFFHKFQEALELFEILQSTISGDAQALSGPIYDSLITASIGLRSTRDAKFVFRHMVENGYEFDLYFRNRILLMHLKCGLIMDVRRLCDEMPERNAVSWNTLISGLLNLGAFDDSGRFTEAPARAFCAASCGDRGH